MRFPKRIKVRGQVLAVIYRPSDAYPNYRVAYRVAGKRKMAGFPTYSEALKAANKAAKDVHSGSPVAALAPWQARDALAALEHLADLRKATGRKLTLNTALADYADQVARLGERSLAEAVDGFLTTVATLRRKLVNDAVEEFITAEEPRTKASNGQRPQLSEKYHYNRSIMLRRFAGVMQNTAVSELSKDQLDAFFAKLATLTIKSRNKVPATSPKVRNHYRASLRQFLAWCVRKDYLPATHRLCEAESMRPDTVTGVDRVAVYTPNAFKLLLDAAEGSMRAMIAIGGLAGLRTQELLRLEWADVSRVEGHIEVTSSKSKTRQRRLVEIVPALAQWLAPFKDFTGKIWTGHEITFQQHFGDLCEKAGVARKHNGLRHSFCTYHYAAHKNENLTAALAGNSPAMIHSNYKGLAVAKVAAQWFATSPEQPANVVNLPAVAQATP